MYMNSGMVKRSRGRNSPDSPISSNTTLISGIIASPAIFGGVFLLIFFEVSGEAVKVVFVWLELKRELTFFSFEDSEIRNGETCFGR